MELWRDIGSQLQIEIVNRLHIQDESSIRYFCCRYKSYYNGIRPHQGICGEIPSQSREESLQLFDLSRVRYEKIKHSHGLFTEFKVA